MDEVQHRFYDVGGMWPRLHRGLRSTATDTSAGITDTRVARLLLVLSEINESVAGLESLPETQLTELVSGAILACGFTDPTEVRSVVATVLLAIEAPGAPQLYAL
ncbi:MAG: hypothetical protein WBV36_11890 [Terriglobales bacterium]